MRGLSSPSKEIRTVGSLTRALPGPPLQDDQVPTDIIAGELTLGFRASEGLGFRVSGLRAYTLGSLKYTII